MSDSAGQAPPSPPAGVPSRVRGLVALAGVLALAAWARSATFTIPHLNADEPLYLALTHGLETQGLSGYTMRHKTAWVAPLGDPPELALVTVGTEEARVGTLIGWYASGSSEYERLLDVPFSEYRPGLPLLLAISRRAIGPARHQVLGVDLAARGPVPPVEWHRRAYERGARRDWPRALELARVQAWAVLPSFLASLAAVALTFALALRATGGAVLPASLAALLLSTAPVEVLAAHLIQPDALACMCCAAGSLLAAASLDERSRRWLPPVTGLVLALGTLVKPHVALVGVAYGLTELHLAWRSGAWRSGAWRESLRALAWFSGVALLVALPWVLVHGARSATGFYAGLQARSGGFGQHVLALSWASYPLNLLGLSPQLLLGVVALPWLLRAGERPRPVVLLAAWSLACVAAGTWVYPPREDRYLLPAYPALALLTALAATRWIEAWSADHRRRLLGRVVAALLVALCLRSLAIGREVAQAGATHWRDEHLRLVR